MADRVLRGSRLGAVSYEADRNHGLAPRQNARYRTENGKEFEVPFADDAEIPGTWLCRNGMEGTLIEGGDLAEPKKVKVPRTPWDMLRETPLDRGTRGTAQGTPRAAAAGLQNSAQFEVEPYSRQPPSAEKYCLTRGKLENEGWIMRFLVSWTLPHGESYRAAAARFLEGGGTPPAGVELIGR